MLPEDVIKRVRDNGLTIILLLLFAGSIATEPPLSRAAYPPSPEFLSSLFENAPESEPVAAPHSQTGA
jgi:hypothetical protein